MPELIPAAPGSPDWLAARRQGVTATDIVTILGLSSWSSAYSLFWQKLGQVPETADNDRFRLGRELEPYVVCRWAEEHGSHIPMGSGLYRHADRPWQMATPDRIMCPAQWDDGHLCAACMPLEVKTWADAARDQWHDGPPPAVRAQVLWQMDVMDAAVGHVGVVFLPSGEFRSYVIEHKHGWRDETTGLISGPMDCDIETDLDLMRAAGLEFMQRLRLELPAPDPDASAATLAAVRARFTRQPDKTAEVDEVPWHGFLAARQAKDDAEAEMRGWETALREQAGEASVLTVDGQPVARRVVSDSEVKAHTRHMDYLRRIKMEANDDA